MHDACDAAGGGCHDGEFLPRHELHRVDECWRMGPGRAHDEAFGARWHEQHGAAVDAGHRRADEFVGTVLGIRRPAAVATARVLGPAIDREWHTALGDELYLAADHRGAVHRRHAHRRRRQAVELDALRRCSGIGRFELDLRTGPQRRVQRQHLQRVLAAPDTVDRDAPVGMLATEPQVGLQARVRPDAGAADGELGHRRAGRAFDDDELAGGGAVQLDAHVLRAPFVEAFVGLRRWFTGPRIVDLELHGLRLGVDGVDRDVPSLRERPLAMRPERASATWIPTPCTGWPSSSTTRPSMRGTAPHGDEHRVGAAVGDGDVVGRQESRPVGLHVERPGADRNRHFDAEVAGGVAEAVAHVVRGHVGGDRQRQVPEHHADLRHGRALFVDAAAAHFETATEHDVAEVDDLRWRQLSPPSRARHPVVSLHVERDLHAGRRGECEVEADRRLR